MSSLQARMGRDKQRYEDEFRLVSGCIPYRLKKDVEDYTVDLENRLEVLMISSPDRDDLVFPKGGWEEDETVWEAACREVVEEAGVKGILNEKPLGVWEFRSKSKENICSREGFCRGYMFALEVTEEFDTWPEKENHGRKWLTVEEAFRLCRYDWMRSALKELLRFLPEGGKYPMEKELVGPPVVPVPVPVSKVVVSPNCFMNPTSTKCRDESCKCISVVGRIIHLRQSLALRALLVCFILLSVVQLAYH